MSTPSLSDIRLHGRMLTSARVAWFAMLALGLVLYVLSIPQWVFQWEMLCTEQQLGACPNLQLTPQQAQELQQLGWSLSAYATYFTTLAIVRTLVFLLIAALIFWRKSDERIALFTSFMLVTVNLGNSLDIVSAAYPTLSFLAALFQFVGNVSLALFIFLFPSGRFVPRWSRWLALLVIAREVLGVFAPNDSVIGALFFVAMPSGLLLQVYRYRRVSNFVQRQQTKWVVFGFALGIGGYGGVITSYFVYVSQGNQVSALGLILLGTALSLFLLMLPLSIGMAILRSRLWDIDIVIRRTLIYGLLTASLAFVYFGSVVLLQQVFRALTGQSSELAIIVSTLAIAALFVPLRRRVQSVIDRRFYRRKYDAQKVLAEFAATARDEVDLNRLSEGLLDVVDATMQPALVSFWLKPQSDKTISSQFQKKE